MKGGTMLRILKENFPGYDIEVVDEENWDVFAIANPGGEDIVICTDQVYSISRAGLSPAYMDITVECGEKFNRFKSTDEAMAYIKSLLAK
jgi:hypothetical protein